MSILHHVARRRLVRSLALVLALAAGGSALADYLPHKADVESQGRSFRTSVKPLVLKLVSPADHSRYLAQLDELAAPLPKSELWQVLSGHIRAMGYLETSRALKANATFKTAAQKLVDRLKAETEEEYHLAMAVVGSGNENLRNKLIQRRDQRDVALKSATSFKQKMDILHVAAKAFEDVLESR